MNVIITGAKGRLGSKLVERLTAAGHTVTATDLPELDLINFWAVRAFIHDHKPEWILHPAAWTDVDGCALEPEKAALINGHATGNIAAAAAEVGAGVAYVSSNEVFDGRAQKPYNEFDAANPINPYGYSKWVGEQSLIYTNPRHMIIRTAWLFAHGGKNFIQSILNAAQAGKTLRVVTNEVANPTYNDDLAEAIIRLVTIGRSGTYHLINEGFCSRFAFARYVLDRAGFVDTPIAQISASEWQRPSVPPEFAPMNNNAAAMLDVRLPRWQYAVDRFLSKEGLMAR